MICNSDNNHHKLYHEESEIPDFLNISASYSLGNDWSGEETMFDLEFDEGDGFSTTEVEFFEQQIAIMDENIKGFLINPAITPVER